jgi:hypothetical protein
MWPTQMARSLIDAGFGCASMDEDANEAPAPRDTMKDRLSMSRVACQFPVSSFQFPVSKERRN